MIKNEYVLVVDVKKKHTAIVPTFVQHDSATLIFKVYDNGSPFDLTNVTSVQVSHQRRDGAVVIGTATYQSVNGESIIKYEYMGNEMSKEGFVETSVTIFSGVDKVTIQPFKVSIVGDFRNALGATEEFGLLQDLIVKTEKTIEDAKTATNKANLSSFNADVATSEANMARDGANAAATNANQKAEYVIANETVREIAETDRKTEESNRKLAESQRVIEEGVRATAEGLRNSSESTRSANEDARILAETDRKDSEIARTTKENNRDLAESTRKTNETARKTSEINRDTAESARTSSETQRDSAEKAREVSETNRQSAETGRISAEDARALAESQRQTDESLRILAETKRQKDTASALEAVNIASTSAQAVIDNSEFKGEFSPDVQYKKNNTVSYNGSSYIAKQDSMGSYPNQPDSLYWGMIAQRGIDGTGSVSSVNGTFPDESGNVTLSVPEGHTHANKVVLDKLSDTAGTLQYNGLDVGSVVSVNGQKGEVTGLETVAGSQEKSTLAEGNAKAYTDQKVVDLTVFEAKEEFIVTEGQTVFNLAGEYEVGKNRITAIVGGVPQYESFTETNSKTVTFSEPLPTGIDVVFIYYKALPVGDGLVTSVNNIVPDVTGNVTLNIPEPDLIEYATKTEINDLAGIGNTKTVKQLDDALTTHLAEEMPHTYMDGTKKYRWGFRTKNGVPQFIREEIV